MAALVGNGAPVRRRWILADSSAEEAIVAPAVAVAGAIVAVEGAMAGAIVAVVVIEMPDRRCPGPRGIWRAIVTSGAPELDDAVDACCLP